MTTRTIASRKKIPVQASQHAVLCFMWHWGSVREAFDLTDIWLDLSFVYKEAIEKFEMNRKFLYEVFGLNHTLKMHIIRDHFVTYFKLTGKTLRDVSAEYHEGVHHTHKNHDTKRGFYQKRGLGGTSHVKKSQRSTAQFNVLHAGFAKQSDLQLRKPNKNKTEVVEICSI